MLQILQSFWFLFFFHPSPGKSGSCYFFFLKGKHDEACGYSQSQDQEAQFSEFRL